MQGLPQSCFLIWHENLTGRQLDLHKELSMQKSLGNSVTSRRFATELVAAVNKVNYNQDSGLNAFAGTVVC